MSRVGLVLTSRTWAQVVAPVIKPIPIPVVGLDASSVTENLSVQQNAAIFPASGGGIDKGQAAIFLCVPLATLQMVCVLRRDERHKALRQHRPSMLAARTQPAIAVRPLVRLARFRHRSPLR